MNDSRTDLNSAVQNKVASLFGAMKGLTQGTDRIESRVALCVVAGSSLNDAAHRR